VKEALASFVGTEDDQRGDRHHRRSSSADADVMIVEPLSSKKAERQQRLAPAPSTNKKPISEPTIKAFNDTTSSNSNKRPTTKDFKDLYCSKPMTLVQDRARVADQPRIRPILSSKCATSA
jgi:hypothetical protein